MPLKVPPVAIALGGAAALFWVMGRSSGKGLRQPAGTPPGSSSQATSLPLPPVAQQIQPAPGRPGLIQYGPAGPILPASYVPAANPQPKYDFLAQVVSWQDLSLPPGEFVPPWSFAAGGILQRYPSGVLFVPAAVPYQAPVAAGAFSFDVGFGGYLPWPIWIAWPGDLSNPNQARALGLYYPFLSKCPMGLNANPSTTPGRDWPSLILRRSQGANVPWFGPATVPLYDPVGGSLIGYVPSVFFGASSPSCAGAFYGFSGQGKSPFI